MRDSFDLSAEERREALIFAGQQAGSRVVLLEKDVWVVWTLNELFTSLFGEHLVFKGGTSLSKGYRYIRRFSEDIDVTYDIRAIAADLVGDADEPLPPTRSQAGKWTEAIRGRLRKWIPETVVPVLTNAIATRDLPAIVRSAGDHVFVEYATAETGSWYVPPSVRIDFGARSTGEPASQMPVVCEAAPHLSAIGFPTATPRVMSAERTFWEKATAIHVFCLQDGRCGGDRFARHFSGLMERCQSVQRRANA